MPHRGKEQTECSELSLTPILQVNYVSRIRARRLNVRGRGSWHPSAYTACVTVEFVHGRRRVGAILSKRFFDFPVKSAVIAILFQEV